MPTWQQMNAALQSWFSDEPPAPKPCPQPTKKPTLASVLADYFKGGK